MSQVYITGVKQRIIKETLSFEQNHGKTQTWKVCKSAYMYFTFYTGIRSF